MTVKVWKPLWMTLALLGSTAVVACEDENAAEEAAEEVADEVDDAT